jgi:N6-L-threonylcarbamoyladenine synthase
MIILGIETSCDETAASLVEDGHILHSNVIASSMDLHAAYGGVVPEIAARSHIESITLVVEQAILSGLSEQLKDIEMSIKLETAWKHIDAIAVTYGAGLGGCLVIGTTFARTVAMIHKKPLYAVNHVEAHVYANFITKSTLANYSMPKSQPLFPLLALIVSGGHSQLALFNDHCDFTLLGQTRDDAIGEAFDKVAKIIGLPYPGGPSVAKAALLGDPKKYRLPKSKISTVSNALTDLRNINCSDNNYSYDFSFSGVKTSVLRLAQKLTNSDINYPSHLLAELMTAEMRQDIAASFQETAIETVVDKTITAYEEFSPRSVVIAGGVAANIELRNQLSSRLNVPIEYADIKLCTDNGAMIATLAFYMIKAGKLAVDPSSLAPCPNLSM